MPKCDTYPPVISKEIYEKEIAMCKELHKSGKCCWGNCRDCGVIALMYKLYIGKIIHGKELEEFKLKTFSK